jgi:hypothetical protein
VGGYQSDTAAERIDGIQAIYALRNGPMVEGPYHGGRGGRTNVFRLDSIIVIGVYGRYETIDSIAIRTNKRTSRVIRRRVAPGFPVDLRRTALRWALPDDRRSPRRHRTIREQPTGAQHRAAFRPRSLLTLYWNIRRVARPVTKSISARLLDVAKNDFELVY